MKTGSKIVQNVTLFALSIIVIIVVNILVIVFITIIIMIIIAFYQLLLKIHNT